MCRVRGECRAGSPNTSHGKEALIKHRSTHVWAHLLMLPGSCYPVFPSSFQLCLAGSFLRSMCQGMCSSSRLSFLLCVNRVWWGGGCPGRCLGRCLFALLPAHPACSPKLLWPEAGGQKGGFCETQ